MSEHVVKLGIVKIGCIGTTPLIEFLLDERAEREDIETLVIGSGACMAEKQCGNIAIEISNYKPELLLVLSPNASMPGPSSIRKNLKKKDIPTIIISDNPTKKIVKSLKEEGFGYIILEAEAMIGARREFLDPVEMSLFNSDIIKVLAITGVFRIIVESVNGVIQSIKRGEKPSLPTIIVDKEMAIKASGLNNPYAKAKAMAAHEIATQVASLSSEGCFIIKDWELYTIIVAAAHEMMRCAAKLADEAREIEKSEDTLVRKPHSRDGIIMSKNKLLEKPKSLI